MRSYGHLHGVISIWEAQLSFQNLLFQFMVQIFSKKSFQSDTWCQFYPVSVNIVRRSDQLRIP